MNRIGLVLTVFAMFFAYCGSARAQTPPTTRPATRPASKPKPKPRTPLDAVTPVDKNPKRHAEFLDRIKQGPVGLLFLGDSITDYWPKRGPDSWAKFADYQPADFGVSGEETEAQLWRIQNGELDGINPKVTVIMIGTNNIGHFMDEKPEWTAAGVKAIVDAVHQKLPQTKVLLLAIFPRNGKDSAFRQRVQAVNDIISKLNDGDKTVYLDIGPKFLDENGEISKEIMADGLHPTAEGYKIWYDAMMPTLGEMLK